MIVFIYVQSENWSKAINILTLVLVTITKVGSRFVVDTSIREETCMHTRICVAVDPKGSFSYKDM